MMPASHTPRTTREVVRTELLARAARKFGGVCPPPLLALVARAAERGPLAAEDFAAFIAAGAGAAESGVPQAALVAGLQQWADAIERRPSARVVQRDHRGAVLAALDCAAETPWIWGTTAGRAAVDALLDLLEHEHRRGVGDRNGMSFAVFESLCPALIGASQDLLRVVPRHIEKLLGGSWDEARAHPLRGLTTPPQPRTIDEVPFEQLCRPEPHPVVSDLRRSFVFAARENILLYDEAPLAVATTSVLLAALQLRDGNLPRGLPESLPAVAARSWTEMIDGLAQALQQDHSQQNNSQESAS